MWYFVFNTIGTNTAKLQNKKFVYIKYNQSANANTDHDQYWIKQRRPFENITSSVL